MNHDDDEVTESKQETRKPRKRTTPRDNIKDSLTQANNPFSLSLHDEDNESPHDKQMESGKDHFMKSRLPGRQKHKNTRAGFLWPYKFRAGRGIPPFKKKSFIDADFGYGRHKFYTQLNRAGHPKVCYFPLSLEIVTH